MRIKSVLIATSLIMSSFFCIENAKASAEVEEQTAPAAEEPAPAAKEPAPAAEEPAPAAV
ncbi:MAG: hypothetical protein V4482_00475 [Pseudomonadota bacterium]